MAKAPPEPFRGYGADYGGIPVSQQQEWAQRQHQECSQRAYDPRYSTMPVPGYSSGYVQSGMHYDFLPRGQPLMYHAGPAPNPMPKPMQAKAAFSGAADAFNAQRKLMNAAKGTVKEGQTVKIDGFDAPEMQHFNGLVGVICGIRSIEQAASGEKETTYDVRCYLQDPELFQKGWPPQRAFNAARGPEVAIEKKEHGEFDEAEGPKLDDLAIQGIRNNRVQLRSMPEFLTHRSNRKEATQAQLDSVRKGSHAYTNLKEAGVFDMPAYIVIERLPKDNVNLFSDAEHPKPPNTYEKFTHPEHQKLVSHVGADGEFHTTADTSESFRCIPMNEMGCGVADMRYRPGGRERPPKHSFLSALFS